MALMNMLKNPNYIASIGLSLVFSEVYDCIESIIDPLSHLT